MNDVVARLHSYVYVSGVNKTFLVRGIECADGGGDVRRDGDRADAGGEGQDPGAATHPPPAEGEPGALLGKPLHGAVRGELK